MIKCSDFSVSEDLSESSALSSEDLINSNTGVTDHLTTSDILLVPAGRGNGNQVPMDVLSEFKNNSYCCAADPGGASKKYKENKEKKEKVYNVVYRSGSSF